MVFDLHGWTPIPVWSHIDFSEALCRGNGLPTWINMLSQGLKGTPAPLPIAVRY